MARPSDCAASVRLQSATTIREWIYISIVLVGQTCSLSAGWVVDKSWMILGHRSSLKLDLPTNYICGSCNIPVAALLHTLPLFQHCREGSRRGVPLGAPATLPLRFSKSHLIVERYLQVVLGLSYQTLFMIPAPVSPKRNALHCDRQECLSSNE
jgi:hypothetical protein